MEFVKILVNCGFNYVVPNNLTRSPLPYFLKNFKWLVYGIKLLTKLPKRKKFSTICRRVRRRINNCSLFNNFNEVKFAFFSPKNYIVKSSKILFKYKHMVFLWVVFINSCVSLLDKSMKKFGFQIPLDNMTSFIIFSVEIYI